MTGRGRARARPANITNSFINHDPAELISAPTLLHCSLPDTESTNQNVIPRGRGRGGLSQNKQQMLDSTPKDNLETNSCSTATSELEFNTKNGDFMNSQTSKSASSNLERGKSSGEKVEKGKNQSKNGDTNYNNKSLLDGGNKTNVILKREGIPCSTTSLKGNSIVTLLKPRRKKREVNNRDDVFDNENLISQRCQYL